MNNTKLNKLIVILAAICTIIPLNIIIRKSDIMNYIILYLPMIIGYIFYFMQYKIYSNKQKRLLNVATCIGIVNILTGLWTQNLSNTQYNSFNIIGLDMFIAYLMFYVSYFFHRIISLVLCIKLLKNNLSKSKIFIILAIVSIIFVVFLKVGTKYNSSSIKEKMFGTNYCTGEHYKGEFIRNIPWECQICGYSTDVINSDKNVPIICFSCSLSTGRCMECGLLQKD